MKANKVGSVLSEAEKTNHSEQEEKFDSSLTQSQITSMKILGYPTNKYNSLNRTINPVEELEEFSNRQNNETDRTNALVNVRSYEKPASKLA